MQRVSGPGFVDVSRDEFFARLFADARDIMPSVRHDDVTLWETASRAVWGRTTPGWKNPGGPKTYAIATTEAKCAQ